MWSASDTRPGLWVCGSGFGVERERVDSRVVRECAFERLGWVRGGWGAATVSELGLRVSWCRFNQGAGDIESGFGFGVWGIGV